MGVVYDILSLNKESAAEQARLRQQFHIEKLLAVQNKSSYGITSNMTQPGDYCDYLDVLQKSAADEASLHRVVKTKLKLREKSQREIMIDRQKTFKRLANETLESNSPLKTKAKAEFFGMDSAAGGGKKVLGTGPQDRGM